MTAPLLKLLLPGQYRRMPWKNGGGITTEIRIEPEGADLARDPFVWRVSAARMDEPGAFSRFPGYDRLLVVTEGDGVRLRHGDRPPAELRAFEVHSFSGDDETHAEPVSGAVTDFGVLIRRDRGRATLEILKVSGRLQLVIRGGVTLVHSLAPAPVRIREPNGTEYSLTSGSTLQVEAKAHSASEFELLCESEAICLVTRIDG